MDVYRAMSILVEQPGWALIPCGTLLLAARTVRSRGAAFCATMWLLYGVYECGMKLRWLCNGDCNIRIDLLVIYPALLAITALGLVLVVGSAFRHSTGSDVPQDR